MTERYARVVASEQALYAVDLFDPNKRVAADVSSYESGAIISYSSVEEQCRIVSIIAGADTALSVIWHALSENGADPFFPDDVHDEVSAIVDNPGIDDPSLADLTHLPFVTIDNEDSRDLDQAMCIASTADQFVLYYALADAAHFVRPGSALFKEALRRGASFYVPGLAVPMLPRALSEDLISLNEAVNRRALVFIITFDRSGEVVSTTVQQARINSAAKLSYGGVQRYYDKPDQSPLAGKPYTATLDGLRRLGRLRISQARQRNVVEYDRSSVEITLPADGQVFYLTDSDRLQVERYNEQISLICNAEGARLLNEAGLSSVVQAVYRVHEAPDTERLIKFSRLLKGLIRHYQLDPQVWVWRWREGKYGAKEYLADYLDRLKAEAVDASLLASIQQHALMLSPASRFSALPGIHHSLKLDYYARFSSPMREIAGIFTHREYLQLTGSYTDEYADDEVLQKSVIDAANRSKEIQKKLNKTVMKKAIDQLFERQLALPDAKRDSFPGTVMSLRSTRVYLRLENPSIRVKIYLRELGRFTGLNYRLDRSEATIVADNEVVFALGQQLSVKAHSYSDDTGRWYLIPVA